MKKFYFVLLLMLPVVANAQRSTPNTKNASVPKVTSYEDFVSKSGVVYTTYSYPIDAVEIVWKSSYSFTTRLAFSIEKVSIGNTSASFLQISHIQSDEVTRYAATSSVMMEESNVKDLCNSLIKMKEIIKKPIPEGAKALYSYINNDGVAVLYEKDEWRIQLERSTKDLIVTSDIDSIITKLQEIIQKFESIK